MCSKTEEQLVMMWPESVCDVVQLADMALGVQVKLQPRPTTESATSESRIMLALEVDSLVAFEE